MFFIISKILSFLIKPTFWILFCLLLALIKKKDKTLYLIISICIYMFFSNDYLYKKIVRYWEVPQTPIENLNQKFEAGILLGGFSEFDYKTKRHNFKKEADRLIYTVHLYNRGIIKKILISGGNGSLIKSNFKESKTIKSFLVDHGIKKSDIITESKSRNTKENAMESSKIINKQKKYLLLTSATHMKRAIYCFEKVDINIVPFSVDNSMTYTSNNLEYIFLPRARTLELWEELIHEIIGYYVYKQTW